MSAWVGSWIVHKLPTAHLYRVPQLRFKAAKITGECENHWLRIQVVVAVRDAGATAGYCTDKQLMTDYFGFSERNTLSFIETSALDSTNVENAFQNILTEIYKIVSAKEIRDSPTDARGPTGPSTSIHVQPTDMPNQNKKCC